MTKYLNRKSRWPVTLGLALMLAPALAAQWRAPRPERQTPRAIAVLESYDNGARRLIPVTFFYERRYYDANLYRATPVPFTLAPETVYEVQHFGKPLGTFTVRGASQTAELAWIGNGLFRTAPDPSVSAKKKAVAPVVLKDPTRPVLHRREGSEGDHPVTAKSAPKAEDKDPDRPVLHRRNAVGDDHPPNATAETEKPAQHPAAEPAAAADSKPPDHPVLRRGKSAGEQSGHDLSGHPDGPAKEGIGPVRREVAVSDAGSSEAQDLLFVFSEPQRREIESLARELARSELQRLAPMRGLALPRSASPQSASPQSAPALADALLFEDEQFVPYDLDYKDYATVVYSARYRAAPTATASDGSAAAGGKSRGWVVTIVARQDENKLIKLYSAISDPRELDLYPEVRLVDAVDPDGYGRFALLFREQKREGVSWLLARVNGYELETLFETAAR